MDRMEQLRTGAPAKIGTAHLKEHQPGSLAPATPLELEIQQKDLKVVSMHMGLSIDQVKRSYDVIALGELKFVCHRERKPSQDETEVAVATSIAHETQDATSFGPDARAVHAWEAGLLMAEYFREHGRPIVAGRNIVEVGAGIGAPGFAAAEVGNAETKVCMTDGNDNAVSLLHTNRELNKGWLGLEADGSSIVHIHTMRWGDKQEIEDTVSMYGPFDTVIGADVVYNTNSAEALYRLIPKLIAPKSQAKNEPTILIAHEVRHRTVPGGALSGRDDALATFLAAMCLPHSAPAGTPAEQGAITWELIAQVLIKTEDATHGVYEVHEPGHADMSKVSSKVPRTASGNLLAQQAMMGRDNSKPNLTVDAHVRAVPLGAPVHHGADAPSEATGGVGNVQPTNKEIIEQAARQPHGTYLLLTLTPGI